jgi:hypothetical protein
MPELPAYNERTGERRNAQRAREPTEPAGQKPAAIDLTRRAAHQGSGYPA